MQTRLPIFNEISFVEALEELQLTHYTVVSKKRLKKSWRISREGTQVILSIPEHFTTIPSLVRPLLAWAQLVETNNFSRRGITQQLRLYEQEIYALIAPNSSLLPYRTIVLPEKKFRATAGVRYDLRTLFDELNHTYFKGALVSWLRWGNSKSKTSYHTKFYDGNGLIHDLITIAGIYNRPTVPLYALESVLYHEMLHIAIPPIEKPGVRRHVHHKAFREAEAQFPHYKKWQKWLTSPRRYRI